MTQVYLLPGPHHRGQDLWCYLDVPIRFEWDSYQMVHPVTLQGYNLQLTAECGRTQESHGPDQQVPTRHSS